MNNKKNYKETDSEKRIFRGDSVLAVRHFPTFVCARIQNVGVCVRMSAATLPEPKTIVELADDVNSFLGKFTKKSSEFQVCEDIGRQDNSERATVDVLVLAPELESISDRDAIGEKMAKLDATWAYWPFHCASHESGIPSKRARYLKDKMDRRPPWGEWLLQALKLISPRFILVIESSYGVDLKKLVESKAKRMDIQLATSMASRWEEAWTEAVEPFLRNVLLRGAQRTSDGKINAIAVLSGNKRTAEDDDTGNGPEEKRARKAEADEEDDGPKACDGDNLRMDGAVEISAPKSVQAKQKALAEKAALAQRRVVKHTFVPPSDPKQKTLSFGNRSSE